MGMTIDEKNKFIEESKEHFKEWHDMNYIPKADYENRLKADLEAMLTEIQLEIEELDLKDSVSNYQKGAEETREYITNMIEEKIDKLKEVQNDREKDI